MGILIAISLFSGQDDENALLYLRSDILSVCIMDRQINKSIFSVSIFPIINDSATCADEEDLQSSGITCGKFFLNR